MRAGGNLIFGDPEETEKTAKESLDWWKKHPEYDVRLRFILAVPDSKVWRHAVEHNLIGDKVQFTKKRFPVVNLTRMSDSKFNEIRRKVTDLEFSKKHFMKGKVLSSKKEPDNYEGKNIYSFTVKCLLCSKVSTYKYFALSERPYTIVLCKHCYKRLKVKTKKAFPDDYNALYGTAFMIYHLYLKRFALVKTMAQGFKKIIRK